MLFGQVVAISTASSLFFLTLVLADPAQEKKTSRPQIVPRRLVLSIFFALASVAATPYVPQNFFLVNLLLMHAAIFYPLLAPTDKPSRKYFSTTLALALITLTSVVLHMKAFLNAAKENPDGGDLFAEIISVIHAHPAQASISWDVIWATLSFGAWAATEKTDARVSFLMYSPFVSIAATAPLMLLQAEVAPPAAPFDEEDEEDEKDK